MRINRPTPEQARLYAKALEDLTAWFGNLREQLVTLAQRLTEAARHLVPLAQRLRAAYPARPDRPAWASPYGPAPKGLR